MNKYENHEHEWREEANEMRRQKEHERARSRFIYSDPFYPPEWAEREWDERYGKESEE